MERPQLAPLLSICRRALEQENQMDLARVLSIARPGRSRRFETPLAVPGARPRELPQGFVQLVAHDPAERLVDRSRGALVLLAPVEDAHGLQQHGHLFRDCVAVHPRVEHQPALVRRERRGECLAQAGSRRGGSHDDAPPLGHVQASFVQHHLGVLRHQVLPAALRADGGHDGHHGLGKRRARARWSIGRNRCKETTPEERKE